jgi:hypothetical protein
LAQEITAYIAVTDRDWFNTLSARGTLDEVNFWQPSADRISSAEGWQAAALQAAGGGN